MAKKYSSILPQDRSPFAQEKQKSTAASNPHIYQELCLAFLWQVFLGNQSNAFVTLSGLALTVGS